VRISWSLPWQDTAPAVARGHVADECDATVHLDDALLITSELVTNAFRHGAEPMVLTIISRPESLTIEVEQVARESRPQLTDAELDSESGRGLALVDSLADSWEWSETEGRIRVRAVLRRSTVG